MALDISNLTVTERLVEILFEQICQLFKNCMRDATNNKSFCLGLKAINEVHDCIVYMTYDIYFFLYRWL